LKVSYDSEQDILYFHFKDGASQSVKEIEQQVIAELDKSGEVMGIEVWNAKKRGLLKQLTMLAVPNQ
jgi:uncharacterized protein YuzE